MKAIDMLKKRVKQKNTCACCGLDPDKSKLPPEILALRCSDEEKVFAFLINVIDVTAPYICAYKIQKACFDIFPLGHDLLQKVIRYIHENYPGIVAIVDCKVGDIDNTMEKFYAYNIFDLLDADGIVVNPYMGDEVFSSLEGYSDKIIVTLVRTSNRGSAVIQDIKTESGKRLWEVVLDLAMNRWNQYGNIVPVISSTAEIDLGDIRKMIPNEVPILFAGVGAQGGDYGEIKQLFTNEESCVFVNSSRGILYPPQKEGRKWQNLVREQVTMLKDELNQRRR